MMSSKSIQIVGEALNDGDIKAMCSILEKNLLKILSLRDCDVTEKDFKKVMKSVGKSKSLLQFALNIGIISNPLRIQLLSQSLTKNKSITGLFIHGSCLGDEGIKILSKSVVQNGRLTTLDIGDCQLGNASVPFICQLLTPTSNWPGLLNLSLSANSDITYTGWTEFSLALAVSTLRSLYLDYNRLGDQTAICIIVGVAGCHSLEILDLEGTGVTQETAKLVLKLVENYSTGLRKVSFSGNKVQKITVEEIKFHLNGSTDDEMEGSDADLLSITTKSSLAEPKHAEVKVVTSSGETESENESDRTMQDYSLQSEIIEQLEMNVSSSSLNTNEDVRSMDDKEIKETEIEDFGEELQEVPAYYTGIPVTF